MGFKFNPFTGNLDSDTNIPADSVVAPSGSSTDNAIVRWDGTSGTVVQDSDVTIDDSGNIVTPGTVTAASYNFSGLTANTAVIADNSQALASSSTTSTELGYVHGVTSDIQTQLNGKLSLSGGTMTGSINMGGDDIINAGHVGIGTSSPTKPLDVLGLAVLGNDSSRRMSFSGDGFAINRNNATGAIYDGSTYAYQLQHTPDPVQANDNLSIIVFAPNGSTVSSGALTVGANGYVGINTLAPLSPLDVHGAANLNSNQIHNVADPTSAQDAATQNYVTTQLGSYIPLSEAGANNGVATLDGGGKIPASQLPNTVMELQGDWNASTNTPTLADGTGNPGDVWEVVTAGTQNLGSGAITFAVGDWAVYGASGVWFKSINSNAVTSVNSNTGAVTVNAINQLTGDITAGPASGSASATATLATVNGSPGSFGDASHSLSATVNGKGLVTTLSSQSIQIAESQVTNLVSDLAGKQATGNYITTLTGDVTASGPGSASSTVANSAITNAKMANMAAHTYKGNNTGSSAAPIDVTSTQLTADLDVFTSSLQGLVPASGGGTSNFLRADGTFAAPPTSSGTVTTVSVVSANGLAGTVANPSTAPAITLSTTITGLLKGNGTAISAASAGTDYQAAGNYITALTGDATASGPGSASLTLATVNGSPGTFGDASHSLAATVNAKGLITSLSSQSIQIAESQVTNLVSDLAGKQAAGNYTVASSGDINETSFTAADNQSAAANVTGLAFANATVRSADILLSVVRSSTYAQYRIQLVQGASSWYMNQSYLGDVTGLTFTVTNAGQVQYTSTSTGSTATIKFRAMTTSV